MSVSAPPVRVGIIGERQNFISYGMLEGSLDCDGVQIAWFADASLSEAGRERRYGRTFRPGFAMRMAAFLRSPFRRKEPAPQHDCARLCERHGIPYVQPAGNSINRGLPPQMYSAPEADYVLIAGCDQILDENGLKIARRKLINFHYSLLPAYRGKYAVFWQWYNREPFVGYSFHEVDHGVDTGRVFFQGTVDYQPEESVSAIAGRAVTAAARDLPEVYRCLVEGTSRVLDVAVQPSYYSIKDYRDLETITRTKSIAEVRTVLGRLGWMRLPNGLVVHRIVDSGTERQNDYELQRDGIRVPLADGFVKVGLAGRTPFWIRALLIGRKNILRGLD